MIEKFVTMHRHMNVKKNNFYMFRAGLLLITKRYFSLHTCTIIGMCHTLMLTGC